jgi:hypothetical protein
MVRISDLKLMGVEYRLMKGDLISNHELADVVQRWGTDPLSDGLRSLIVERLRVAPTPRPRGRPKNPKARAARALTIYNQVVFEWAQLGGRRGQRTAAIEKAAEILKLKPETVRDALENDAPAARRQFPSSALTVAGCVEYLARVQDAPEEYEEPGSP